MKETVPLESKATMMSIVRNVIPEIEEVLANIDKLKDENPSFQMAAIYIDQALHILKNEMPGYEQAE
ncbi:hypothetical protein [Novosphingobium sp. PASSN1]|uniref:hypothetical protein n=1 Tax=Novosphingobium sp. PASSN1 TaxID=2015561 RepID=UPI000BD8CA60|nr:hypothetical protein [Novosphingobium sp. PASSN1]OYU34299.1 MAG: hypothetical protein CFE35_15015 [Novosphingobium sp. PASSN1]